MALTPTEEAQTRQLIAQEAPLLSLASNEPTITSKLGATKVNLSQLPAATVPADADIYLVRQGTTDKSVAGSVLKTYFATAAPAAASETVAGIVRLATDAETLAGTARNIAVDPGGLAATLSAKIQPQISSITATVSANALTGTFVAPANISFRNPTLTNGTPVSASIASNLSLVVPSNATLGTTSSVAARLIWLLLYNAGNPVLAVTNLAGGLNLDETNLVSSIAIGAGSASANAIYSTASITNSPFRVIGFTDISEATAGTWATAPTVVQGIGGQAFAAMAGFGFGQTLQDLTASRTPGTTYYNTTGKPIKVRVWGTSNTTTPQQSAAVFTVNGVIVDNPVLYQAGVNYIVTTEWIVLPGQSYSVTFAFASGGTYTKWLEQR